MAFYKLSKASFGWISAFFLASTLNSASQVDASTIDPPVVISGTSPNPATSCVKQFEAVPERPGPGGFGFVSARIFAVFGFRSYNWVQGPNFPWNIWQSTSSTLPTATGLTASGDAWSASSSGAMYASVIGTVGSNRCIASLCGRCARRSQLAVPPDLSIRRRFVDRRARDRIR